MKVSELKGAELDYWVAKAHGWNEWTNFLDGDYEGDYPMFAVFEYGIGFYDEEDSGDQTDSFNFHREWMDAGQIIEREKINLNYRIRDQKDEWSAWVWSKVEEKGSRLKFYMKGPTPLIAAMRCYVASKYGDEVPTQSKE